MVSIKLKDITTYVQGITPLLIMSGMNVNMYYIICLPLMIQILNVIWIKISKWINRNKKTIVYTQQSRLEYYEGNEIYRDISWYLSTNVKSMKVNNLRCDYCPSPREHMMYGDMNDENDKFVPIYEIGENDRVEFIHNDCKIFITYDIQKEEKNTVKKLTIESDNIQNIIDFGFFCHETKKEFLKTKGKKIYHYNIWNSELKDWQTFPICTIKTFKNTFLLEDLRNKLINDLDEVMTSKDFYIRSGVPYKRGLIFHGKPGCGKSSTIFAIANRYQKNIYFVNLDQFESAKEFESAVLKIEIGGIVVIEDIDSHKITHSREKDTNKTNMTKVVKLDKKNIKIEANVSMFKTLLEILDGYNFLPECIVIMTTNHLSKIDSAIIRPGRFDMKFEFENPNIATVEKIFEYFFEDVDKIKSEFLKIDKTDRCLISSSELINTIIMPNRRNLDCAFREFLNDSYIIHVNRNN